MSSSGDRENKMPLGTPSKRRWGLGQIQRTQQITEQKEKEKNRLGVRYDQSVDTGLHIYTHTQAWLEEGCGCKDRVPGHQKWK